MAADGPNLPRGPKGRPKPDVRRDTGARRSLLLRLTVGSWPRRRSRLFIALAAMAVGVAVVTALATVYLDLRAKMTRELRGYGANLVVAPEAVGEESHMSLADAAAVRSFVPPASLHAAAPYLHGLTDLSSGPVRARAALTGTEFDAAFEVNPFWRVTGRPPAGPGEALVGILLARRLGLSPGDRFQAKAAPGAAWTEAKATSGSGDGDSASVVLLVAGILHTGGNEDERVFLDLEESQALLGRPGEIATLHLSVLSEGDDLERLSQDIAERFSGLTAEPVKRVSQSDGRVLLRLGVLFYLVLAVVLVTSALGVVISMLTMTLERRRELGLKKALGAETRDLFGELAGEAALIASTGGLLGVAGGFGLAQWVGWTVFGSGLAFHPTIVPVAVTVAAFIASLASLAPLRVVTTVDPAVVLKEE
ncbi:MAG: ABC transporter permease [Thermoleophilia bacterium]